MSDERQQNNSNNPWWGEHVHRYQEVLKLLPPSQKILDIACGNGFGSMLLASKGHVVTGGDISREAIDYCNSTYSHQNLSFTQMDATSLPYPNEYFDSVISFETIEHTTEFNKLLTEFKRVVHPNGFILISTPNIIVNSPNGIIVNPFHTQEWQYRELLQLLNEHYSDVNIWGQEYCRYLTEGGDKRHSFARIIERLLYSRVIRKIPTSIQDKIMQLISKKPIYPQATDYQLTNDPRRITRCKTFFAICKS